MQSRRNRFSPIAALLAVGALAIMATNVAADVMVRDYWRETELRTKAAKLRTNDVSDPDTVWIGHVFGTTGLPGTAGGYGPFHIGRGGNFVNTAGAASNNGYWDFDRFNAGETDSLQGWVPVAIPFGSIGTSNFPDRTHRMSYGFDYGNQGNYVGNQGHIAGKRTFGITGYWHRDPGSTVPGMPDTGLVIAGPDVEWAPLGGSFSAWCGLRVDADLSVVDEPTLGGTGNHFNSSVLQYQGNNSGDQTGSLRTNGTDHNFPGYGSQWDQMLYRDVTLADNANLNLSFKYRTNMSTAAILLTDHMCGWYDKDPLKTAALADGNFISANDAAATNSIPVDSFMVYIGVPAEPVVGAANDFTASDGLVRDIYDVKRRWFSEVIRVNQPYRELLTRFAVNATSTATFNIAGGAGTIVQQILDAQAGAGGNVRIVFRVKTNRSGDDEDNGRNLFSSLTAGAAIIDDVVVNGWAAVNGNFESSGAIDNRAAMVEATSSTTSGSTTVSSSRGEFTYVEVGYAVAGAGIPGGATVAAKASNFSLTLSAAATASGTNVRLHFTGPSGVQPTSVWKSTGKPPGAYFHTHSVQGAGLPYDDPCGAITSPNRLCNLIGKIMTPGDHDLGEKSGGVFGANDQDRQKLMVSPTINLMSTAPGDYNGMGIDSEIADASGDYNLFSDIYGNLIWDFATTGNGIRWLWQSYPSIQPNGAKVWGEIRKVTGFYALGVLGCLQWFAPGAKTDQLIATSNASGIPDSLRACIEQMSRCFTQPDLTASDCSPTSGPYAGCYIDNLSVAFIDAASPPGLAALPWDFWNDAFPTNSGSGLVGAPAFDTLAAQVRTGYNTAQNTGTPTRHNIPGDSTIVTAAGDGVRVDLIFRILPGVGNYLTIGNRGTVLRKRPDGGGAAGNGVAGGDGSFWGTYQADAGIFGTGGNGVTGQPHDPDAGGPIVAGTRWDRNHWNSARMDTAEINLFYCVGNGVANLPDLTPGTYASMYHEQEPKRAVLGVPHNRCFLITDANGAPTTSANITCGNVPYPPPWTATPGSGYNATEYTGPGGGPGKTLEGTKIIPNGQLTPGAHVEYFYRKSKLATPLTAEMMPDTFQIFPNADGWFDGHRWQEIGVLPDRWKDPSFGAGGSQMACMLVVDLGDRRQDELAWVSMADSIGLTAPNKYGAHNGWHARGDQDITLGVNPASTPPGIPAMAVREHIGQAGSMWDLFQVHAGESNVPAGRLGSRAASQANPGLAAGKFATAGPTGEMLRFYYRTMVFMAGDLSFSSIGPSNDQSDDDIGLFQDFLTNPQPTGTTPRGFLMNGEDLAFGQDDPQTGHPTFFPTFFGATFRTDNYRIFSSNIVDEADLLPQPPINTSGSIYGVFNACFVPNDVLNVNAAVTGAQAGAFYENTGANGPYIASVYAPDSPPRIARTILEGYRVVSVGSRFTLTSGGARSHYLKTIVNIFGALNCIPVTAPIGVGDGPEPGTTFVNFLNLRSENPMRSGEARIAFGITKTEKVEIKVYDVTGRLVKTLANRVFPGGTQHSVTWDGTDDAGHSVARGVYFYQLRSPSFTSQKKLAVLSN
jgi:flagellar hook capping protein FlgD